MGKLLDEAIELWKYNRTDVVLGEEFSVNAFLDEVLKTSKGMTYRIYIGRTLGDLTFFQSDEQCINSGKITDAFFANGQLYVELDGDKDYYSEHFSLDRVKAVYASQYSKNQYYLVLKDDSYFKISIY
jgi:hypothetical protein